jgi:hypothetical protein
MRFEKIKLPNIEQPFNFQEQLFNGLTKCIVNQRDETIKAALVKNGLNPNDIDFLKENIQRVVFEDDAEFEHYYYHFGQDDEKRIISIEINPKIQHRFNEENFSSKVNYTQKYY